MSAGLAAVTLAAVLQAGCEDTTGPDPETVSIELEVGGGFADVAFTILVDGSVGVVRGVTCARGCSFEPDEVILPISAFQVADLADGLEDAGIAGYDGRDFGIECCDQFEYRLTYRRNLRQDQVAGSSGALPDAIARLSARLHALAHGRVPSIVDFASGPADWPGDALTVDGAEIEGSELAIQMTWSGGCADHSVDIVFWNGFLESQPVQVDALLSHDSRNDRCDAIAFESRRFDLTPLRTEWHRAYGPGPGAVVIRLAAPGSPETVAVTYTF